MANPQRDRLFLAAAVVSDARMQPFVTVTRQSPGFAKGEGLPGLVWQTEEAQLWQAVAERPDFLRREAAREVGLETVYGLPLFSREVLLGVLVVGSQQPLLYPEQFSPLLPEFGHQFGGQIRRKQLEQELAQILPWPPIFCVSPIGPGAFTRSIPPCAACLNMLKPSC